MKKILASCAAGSLLLAGLVAGATPSATAASATLPALSIRAELDVPGSNVNGPKIFEVRDTTVGAGAELSHFDLKPGTANRWCGDIKVDFDPYDNTFAVSSDTQSCDFTSVTVRVTSPNLRFGAVTDDQLQPGVSVKRTAIDANTFELSWKSSNGPVMSGVSTFSYTHTSKLTASAKSTAKKKATVSARLSTFGVTGQSGTVGVFEGSKKVASIAVANGVGKKTFSARSGKHTYTLKYAGAAGASAASAKTVVKVRSK